MSKSKKIKIIKKHIKKFIKKFDKNIIFSIGENCLADDILARNGLKSFSSPYASARSNIEYVLSFEKEHFRDFLNPVYLSYDDITKSRVGRNKKYVETENKYYKSCSRGFEFTHHDVIGDDKIRKNFVKRYKRLLSLKKKNIIMLYHHRVCEETDTELMKNHLRELSELYESRKNKVHIFWFTQTIVSSKNQRRAECFNDNGIRGYNFYTMNAWAGDNEDFLWARVDDDLLKLMTDDIKNTLV